MRRPCTYLAHRRAYTLMAQALCFLAVRGIPATTRSIWFSALPVCPPPIRFGPTREPRVCLKSPTQGLLLLVSSFTPMLPDPLRPSVFTKDPTTPAPTLGICGQA